jgi:hypothetical protein
MLNVKYVHTLYDCKEMFSIYREEGMSVSVPAEEQRIVDEHHSEFLKYMSDDLKTTYVLDVLMDLWKAINSNLNYLKVCWCRLSCFLVPSSIFFEIIIPTIFLLTFNNFSTFRNCSRN